MRRSRRWLIPAGLFGLPALLLLALWRPGRPQPLLPPAGALRNTNVLLVTIDTLRADRLGTYGAAHPTPALDQLASSGVRFTRAYTHAVMTLPAHASLLTGLVPPRHGLRTNGPFRLPESIDTLAERLKAIGYRTGAFVGAFVLDRRFGLDQGFDEYDDRLQGTARSAFGVAQRPADRVFSAALEWLRAPGAGPWFAWVHLFDPHTPYEAPRRTGDPYTDEVLALDGQIGGFLNTLRTEARLARTLVVVTADHGEGLGDHGEATHGLFAYEATLRVPLIVAGPEISPAVVDQPVSHVQVAATILSVTGGRMQDVDGGPLARVEPGPDDGGIYFEAMDAHVTRRWAPLTGVVDGSWKYIDLPIPELYDLSRDPSETDNLAAREPDQTTRLARRVADWRHDERAAERATTDADAADRLRSLGYTSAPAPPRGASYTAADDPKTLLPLHLEFMAALERGEQGDPSGALQRLRTVTERRPDFAAAYTTAATLLIAMGDAHEAIRWLERARSRGVESVDVDERLGAALLAAGDPGRAASILHTVVSRSPENVDAWNTLAVAWMETGRTDEARRAITRALEAAPSAPGIWTNLGFLELKAARRPEAATAFRRATGLDPQAIDAWRGLGAAALDAGDSATAVQAWTRAAALDPADPSTIFNLGVLLAQVAPAEASAYLERFLRLPDTSAADRAHATALLAKVRTQNSAGRP